MVMIKTRPAGETPICRYAGPAAGPARPRFNPARRAARGRTRPRHPDVGDPMPAPGPAGAEGNGADKSSALRGLQGRPRFREENHEEGISYRMVPPCPRRRPAAPRGSRAAGPDPRPAPDRRLTVEASLKKGHIMLPWLDFFLVHLWVACVAGAALTAGCGDGPCRPVHLRLVGSDRLPSASAGLELGQAAQPLAPDVDLAGGRPDPPGRLTGRGTRGPSVHWLIRAAGPAAPPRMGRAITPIGRRARRAAAAATGTIAAGRGRADRPTGAERDGYGYEAGYPAGQGS